MLQGRVNEGGAEIVSWKLGYCEAQDPSDSSLNVRRSVKEKDLGLRSIDRGT